MISTTKKPVFGILCVIFIFGISSGSALFDGDSRSKTTFQEIGSGSEAGLQEEKVFVCESPEHMKWVKDLLSGYIFEGKLNMFDALKVNNAAKDQQGFMLAELLKNNNLPQLPACMPERSVSFDETHVCGSPEHEKWVRDLITGYIFEGRLTMWDAMKVNDAAAEVQGELLDEILQQNNLPPLPACTSENDVFVCHSPEHEKWVRELVSGYIFTGKFSMFDALKINNAAPRLQAALLDELLKKSDLPPLPACIENTEGESRDVEIEYECGSKEYEKLMEDVLKEHIASKKLTSFDAFKIKMTPKSLRQKKLTSILKSRKLPPIASCHEN